jgi:hypothetical protein
MLMINMGLGPGTQVTPRRLFKKRSQTLKPPCNPDFNKLEPVPPRCTARSSSSSSSSLVQSRTPLQNMGRGIQRDSAMRNLVEEYDSEDENGKRGKGRQKSRNGRLAYTYPMILEVLEQFDDPQERLGMFKAELQYLQRWPANTIEDEISRPDWARQLMLAIRDEEFAIQDRRSERDCSQMTGTFAQSMALSHQAGPQGRATAPPAGGAAPTTGVRGICKGTRKPSTGPSGKRVLTWRDDDPNRSLSDSFRITSNGDESTPIPPAGPPGTATGPHQNGKTGRPPSGRAGKGPFAIGLPPALPPRQPPTSGTVVTGRPPARASDHLAITTNQTGPKAEVVDPSNARFHANRGHVNGQAAGNIAINARHDGQMGAAGPAEKKPLHKRNEQAGQDAGRKPARPSRPRRLTESVDDWMDA